MRSSSLKKLLTATGTLFVVFALTACAFAKDQAPETASAAFTLTPTPTSSQPPTLNPTCTLTPPHTHTPSPTSTSTPPPLVTAPPNGVPQIALHITLNYADKRLMVTQQMTLINDSPDTWEELVFAVPPAYQPDVFTMRTAAITTTWESYPTTAVLSSTMLHVAAPLPIAPGEAVAVALVYGIAIPPVDADAWLPLGNLGAGERLIQAGDWHPTLAPYRPGDGWQTWEYVLVGDPNIYGIADYDVILRTDTAVVVAAPGLISQKGQVRRYRLDQGRAFAFLASPEYRAIRAVAEATPVQVYFLPEFGTEAQAVLKTASQALSLYTELYGPYPYTNLVIAQNAYFGAMEYSGLVSMSGRAYEGYQETPVAGLINLTAHEIAHQWWYGAVGNDQVHEPWLDESFAKYSEVLFYERYYPDFVEWWWEHHIGNRNLGGALDRPIYDFTETATYIDQVYAQGARFMGDLRALMGDSDFFTFVKAYREANEGRIATRDDFFAAVRAHTDADLTPLLDSYFSD
ncbi:MAG: M1 family metallopeptidase [Anaerolineae bacterium]